MDMKLPALQIEAQAAFSVLIHMNFAKIQSNMAWLRCMKSWMFA
jgi:hypothetical protein